MSAVEPQISRTQGIATILREEILSGQYRAGERLPSERDLSERFKVSRGAVREALKQLQQLGIASIQPGGARVVPVEECTLDVLGPLLELNDVPDPKLVDEVMHMIGVLMREAASVAIEKASDGQLAEAEAIIDEILACTGDPARQFEALRKLADFYVSVADHLVLRLMVNGLRTQFMEHMSDKNPMIGLGQEAIQSPVKRIRSALIERNAEELGTAMLDLNRLFRDSTHIAALQASGNDPMEPQ